MKRYIVCDEYSDYKDISNYDDLKLLLIDEIERDTFKNIEDESIVENNFKEMRKLATEKVEDINYLRKQLMSFGWYVMDLISLQNDLNNYQAYKYGNGSPLPPPHDCIEETLKMIREDMK